MTPTHILVIEDEPKLVAFLANGLQEQGYQVTVAYDGEMGERLFLGSTFDLIILDVVLPYQNGYELCKKVRKQNSHIPILMLTALGATDDKLKGFDAGADDYLVKPFEFKELLARIRVLVKRSGGFMQELNCLQLADLVLDLDKKTAFRSGITINLTAKEYLLLELLLINKGRVLSRAEIAEKVWEITFDTGTNVVDVYINLLRKKVDKDFPVKLIHTKVGLGYVCSETI